MDSLKILVKHRRWMDGHDIRKEWIEEVYQAFPFSSAGSNIPNVLASLSLLSSLFPVFKIGYVAYVSYLALHPILLD